jgi:uncharacterized protein
VSIETPQRSPRTPLRQTERALTPDLARGAMLLIIAVANAAGVVFAGEPGLDPAPEGVDRGMTFLLFEFAHARGYPVFAVMFGYGLVQLANRQDAAGTAPERVRTILLRRNLWLIVFGFLHAALLYYGDFLGAYGIVGVAMTLLLLRRGEKFQRIVLVIWAFAAVEILVVGGLVVDGILGGSGPAAPLPVDHVASLDASGQLDAMRHRLAEWPAHTLTVLPFILIAWLGMWAARRGVLEAPGRYRTVLIWVAVSGIGVAVIGGLPAALIGAGWLDADESTARLAMLLHGGSGMFAGPGYAAVFGLLALRITRLRPRPGTDTGTAPGTDTRTVTGTVAGAIAALGRRSLSGYLVQSVAWFVLLLPFTVHVADRFESPATAGTIIAVAVWLATVVLADLLDKRGRPGPAEKVLRRLTYGLRTDHTGPRTDWGAR